MRNLSTIFSEIPTRLTDTEIPSRPAFDVVVSLAPGQSDPSDRVCRLVALVPDLDVDEADLVQRVWSLAEPRQLPVLYLSLIPEDVQESRVRRQLATLAALTRHVAMPVETRHMRTKNWLEAIRTVWRPGDLIVCPPEPGLSYAGNGHAPVGRTLAFALRTPVHVLSDLRVTPHSDHRPRVMRLAFWPVALVILAGFFWLQAQIELATQGGVRMLLLGLTVLLEGGLLLVWNALTN